MLGLTPRDCWEYEARDLLCALDGLIMRKQEVGRLEILGLGGSIPVRSGRAGLVTAIRALGLPPGARIGVPLFCCRVVFDAIVAAGCTTRFIDIDPETFCLSSEDVAAKRHQMDALVAVHMFGNLCNIPIIREAAREIPIIEDCAQALGSMFFNQMAGSLAEVSFFSFRSGKYLSVGEGGAVFSHNENIMSRVEQLTSAMKAPSSADECIHAAKTYIKSILRTRPLYGLIGYPLWQTVNRNNFSSGEDSIALTQIFTVDLALINQRLAFLKDAISKQRAHAEFFLDTLQLPSSMLCREKRGMEYNRYHFPVVFPSMDIRNNMATALFKHQIDTIKYLDNIVDIAVREYGYARDCPMAEQLSRTTLIIPSYHSLHEGEIERIAHWLNEEWKAVNAVGTVALS